MTTNTTSNRKEITFTASVSREFLETQGHTFTDDEWDQVAQHLDDNSRLLSAVFDAVADAVNFVEESNEH